MKNKRKVSIIAMSAILVGMLSFSAYAASGSASASGTSASASVSSDVWGVGDVTARMSNASDWTGDSFSNSHCKALSASASASDLPGYPGVPVQTSRASAYFDDKCYGEEYWTP